MEYAQKLTVKKIPASRDNNFNEGKVADTQANYYVIPAIRSFRYFCAQR